MQIAENRIPVRSREQALDWSLVLVSQGIETTIQVADDGIDWGLLVAAKDYVPALRALRQYRLENRIRPPRHQALQPIYWFDWGTVGWLALILLFFWMDNLAGWKTAGAMDTARVAGGQWWRLCTAVWLHADLGHLASNAAVGLLLLGLAMGRYGTGVGLLAAYAAGIAGNLASWLLGGEPHRSLGASGMVMGGLGLLAAQSPVLFRARARETSAAWRGLLAGAMLFVLLGLTPGTDIAAHFGGFVAGIALGGILSFIPSVAEMGRTNLACGLAFAALVILPWWLALRPH